jgi:hypothetical protein
MVDERPKEKTMKTYFYYMRDEENRPVITCCYIITPDGCARGMAICSDADNPNKKVGRQIAEGRAFRALVHQKSFDPIRDSEAETKDGPIFKSHFNPPTLSYLEEKFLCAATGEGV